MLGISAESQGVTRAEHRFGNWICLGSLGVINSYTAKRPRDDYPPTMIASRQCFGSLCSGQRILVENIDIGWSKKKNNMTYCKLNGSNSDITDGLANNVFNRLSPKWNALEIHHPLCEAFRHHRMCFFSLLSVSILCFTFETVFVVAEDGVDDTFQMRTLIV